MRVLTFFLFCFLGSVSVLRAEGKVVLITGASRGIGRATAEYLTESGYSVYAGVRDLNSVDFQGNERIHVEKLDVTDPFTIQKTVDKIVEKEGRLDILINNAGYALAGPQIDDFYSEARNLSR